MPQILTPTGYRNITDCQVGDAVVAFNIETGEREINEIIGVSWITRESFLSSNPHIDGLGFDFYRVNGIAEYFQDQSVWANGKVTHASVLKVGDTIYDDQDRDVVIDSIEKIDGGDGWWRFIISGDHSYIVDGFSLHNASRFWVGGGSANTWAATSSTNWASSSGGSNNQTVPGTSDIAIFDSHSGSSNSVIGANITVTGLECDGSTLGTGTYAGTLTHNTGVTLTINTGQANSFRLASGMTYTPASASSLVTLTHTSGIANTKLNGQKLFAFTVNGAGGTTQTLDAFLVNAGASAILTVTNGIFDLNGGAGGPFPLTSNIVSSNNANTRSLILGGTVTIGGNIVNASTPWNLSGAGLTFTKNSANLIVLAPTSAIQGFTFSGDGLTYNNVTFNNSTNNTDVIVNGANTYTNFTVGSGWNLHFINGSTQTFTNAFTWTGTQANPILVFSQSDTAVATLSCASGACSLTWGGLFGITGSGGATFTGTNVFNFGTNTGWAFSAPADETITLTSAAAAVLNAIYGAGRGTVTTGGSTTSVPTSAFTINGSAAGGVVSNQFVGQSITFDGGTTTAGLRGASAVITASSTSNTPTFTVTPALPATPASGDTFSVVQEVVYVGANADKTGYSLSGITTANVTQINGDANAASNLQNTLATVFKGTVGSSSSTTSLPTSAFTEDGSAASGVVSNQFVNRNALFDSATTTAGLRGVSSAISANTASNTPTLTVATLPASPTSGDTFSII